MKLMKHIASLLLAVLMCCSFALAEDAPSMAGMPNPWTEVDSLEALNEAADVNLQLPPRHGRNGCRLPSAGN